METRDWSLVFFTVLTQAAVGAFLVLQVLGYLSHRRRPRERARATDDGSGAGRAEDGARRDGSAADAGMAGRAEDGARRDGSAADAGMAGHAEGAARREDLETGGDGPDPADERSTGHEAAVSLQLVFAVLSAGLFAALFHLSTPLQAARAVVNFSSSWLSREIVFGSLFAALLGALAWREWRATHTVPTRQARGRRAASSAPAWRASADPVAATSLAGWLPRLAAAAGLAFLACQTAIYLLPAQPAWNSFATPAAFGGTALRLGILGVAAGLVGRCLAPEADDPAAGPTPASSAILRGLALAGILALALEFAVVPLHLAALAGEPSAAAAASAQRLTGDYGGVLLLRLGLLAAAAAALGGVVALVRRPLRPSRHRLAAALTSGALGLVLVSEVCGRFLFYAMRVRVGI